MPEKTGSQFVYITYIRATPQKVWSALIEPKFLKQYWMGALPEAEWKLGGAWKIGFPNGAVADTGEIVAFEPGRKLAIKWQNEKPELKAEGWSLCTMEIESVNKPDGVATRLTVTHSIDRPDSKLIVAVSAGWPQILSNLKSLLENGSAVLDAPVNEHCVGRQAMEAARA